MRQTLDRRTTSKFHAVIFWIARIGCLGGTGIFFSESMCLTRFPFRQLVVGFVCDRIEKC
jgi:hypothetical protein